MERGRGNGLFVLLIVLGLGAAAGGVWYRRHLHVRTMVRNESNAVAALRSLTTAEADFRANDRDGNGVDDFWTGDVAGLFTVKDKNGIELRLIGRDIAEADALPLRPAAATPVPFHGYLFRALDADDSNPDPIERIYRQDTGGVPPAGKVHHPSAFGFCAYPAEGGASGRYLYIINENNTVFRAPTQVGTPKYWPSDNQLRQSWSHTNW